MRRQKGKKNGLQAKEKAYVTFAGLAHNASFVKGVEEVRKMFSLPKGGFTADIEDRHSLINSLPVVTDESGNEIVFEKAVYDLASQFGITVAWLENVTGYILYDDFFYANTNPLVQMLDVLDLLEGAETAEDVVQYLENVSDSFPLAILISPYATGRDILDFVKRKHKKEITPVQSRFKMPDATFGKTRKRNFKKQERDLFICKHKHLPTKEIISKIRDKYGEHMDYSYVNKIIRTKCKRGK